MINFRGPASVPIIALTPSPEPPLTITTNQFAMPEAIQEVQSAYRRLRDVVASAWREGFDRRFELRFDLFFRTTGR